MVTKWLGELIRDVFVAKSKAVVKTIPLKGGTSQVPPGGDALKSRLMV